MTEYKNNHPDDDGCCIEPTCSTIDCKETICALEFPGGMKTFLRYKALCEQLDKGLTIPEAAQVLGLSKRLMERTFHSARR